MLNRKQKGFTLTELLVVVAIVGMLAGIIFTSINPNIKINKANDASAIFKLAQVRTQATIAFSANQDYSSFCSGVATLVDDCLTGTNDSKGKWAASVNLIAGNNLGKVRCIDSSGKNAIQELKPFGAACD